MAFQTMRATHLQKQVESYRRAANALNTEERALEAQLREYMHRKAIPVVRTALAQHFPGYGIDEEKSEVSFLRDPTERETTIQIYLRYTLPPGIGEHSPENRLPYKETQASLGVLDDLAREAGVDRVSLAGEPIFVG